VHRQDSVLLEDTLARSVIVPPTLLLRSGSCLDRVYIGRRIDDHVWQIGMVPWIRGRRDQRKAKREGARARRWVVERSHSWLNRYRCVLVRWEKGQIRIWPCCTLPVV
jgi:transposase